MKISKGQKLIVKSRRKGNYLAVAEKDFDTEDEWYPVLLDQERLEGLSKLWYKGEPVPTRRTLGEIELREEE